MFFDLPSPAEASSQAMNSAAGFAQAGTRYPLFGIMLCSPPRRAGAAQIHNGFTIRVRESFTLTAVNHTFSALITADLRP